MKKCPICGMEFSIRTYHNKKYCSKECYRKSYKPKNTLQGIVPRKHMGAYSELVVILDLFRKGYEVYRAVSDHCSGDIVIEKDSQLIKIDATTGYVNLNGSYAYPPKEVDAVIAVYLTDQNRVVYIKNGKEVAI